MQKNCKKIAKKLQKNCKKLQKNCKKIAKKLRKICKIFAEFLQLHILQNVLQFRPREESVSPVKLNSNELSVRRNLNTDFELKKSISEGEYDIPDDVIPHETTDELMDKQLNALKNKDYNQRLLNQEIAFRMKAKKITLKILQKAHQ